MTKLARAAALLVTVVMGVASAACTSDASSRPHVSATRSSSSAQVAPPPKVGQCRNTPARNLGFRNLGYDVGVDDTPVVDCSKTHTLETVEVIKPAEKLTLALARQLAAACEGPAVNYLGISFSAVRDLADQVVYWPSRAQRAAGQNWLRCEVGVQATTACCRHLVPQTGSLRGAVGSDPVRFQVCINQLPDPNREQPLTSCKKPHRAEALPTGLQRDVTHYPSAAALSTKGRSDCAKLVSHRKDRESLVVTPSWQSEAQWSGGSLFGMCWIHRDTGLMPPIK
jgi:hypothetical protein